MNAVREEIFHEEAASPEQREQAIRGWIARKESVCPYAPGLAHFVHMPRIDGLGMEYVHYLAMELKTFYEAKVKGKRVGRWMLMPYQEWQSHEEAHKHSELVFWLLNAAYFHLFNDRKRVRAALNRDLDGYDRGYKGEILNPIVGKLPNPNASVVPAKSLFYSALSPLYRTKTFYRYSPYSIMPLVYASEFHELKLKHPKVTESVTFQMAHGGLYEHFGEDLALNLKDFRQELPIWGAIVDRTAEILRANKKGLSSRSPDVKGCPASNLSYFRLSDPKLVDAIYVRYAKQLNILTSIVRKTRVAPKQVIAASFAGSGLYTIPDYPA